MPWLTQNRRRLELFRQGNQKVLGEVYDAYAPGLLARLGSATGGQLVAAPFELGDLVQETFIRAFAERARKQYDGVRPFSAYLHAIARNILADKRRVKGRRQALDERLQHEVRGEHEQFRGSDTPDAAAMQAELRRHYLELLASLPPVEQQLIVWRLVENRTRREVSDLTGLSPMQVRTREARLRELLYDRFVAAGYHSSHMVGLLFGILL